MGRRKKQLPEDVIIAMRANGKQINDIAAKLGVCKTTISRRLTVLHREKGILTKYRSLQSLQLTELQSHILSAVDSKNFENASLTELLQAFHVLKKAELAIQGKESFKLKGLLDHLRVLERQE